MKQKAKGAQPFWKPQEVKALTNTQTSNGNYGPKPTFLWTQSETKSNFVVTNSQGSSSKPVASGKYFNNNSMNMYNMPQKAKGPRPFWKPEEVKALTNTSTKQDTSKSLPINMNLLSGMNQRPAENSHQMMEVHEYEAETADVEMMEVDQMVEVCKPKTTLFGGQSVSKVDEPIMMEVDEQENGEMAEVEQMEVEETNVVKEFKPVEAGISSLTEQRITLTHVDKQINATRDEVEPMDVEEINIIVQEVKHVEAGKSEQEMKSMWLDKQIIAAKNIPRMKCAYGEPSVICPFEVQHQVLNEECVRDDLNKPDQEFRSLVDENCDNMTNLNSPDKSEKQAIQDLSKNEEASQCPNDTNEAAIALTNISNAQEYQLLTDVIADDEGVCPEDIEIPADECEIVKNTEKEQSLFDIISSEVKIRLQKDELERTKFCWSPLNVCQMFENLIAENGENNLSKKLFWKLVISLPPEGSILNCDHDRFTKWLARKFKVAEECLPEDGAELCLGHTQRLATSTGKGYGSVDMCIRSTRRTSFHALTMQGVTSILFYIRDQSETSDLQQLLEMESERLSLFLGNKPFLPAPTLTIIGAKNQNWTTDYVSQSLRLNSYVEKELIESFNVVMCDDICQKETSHQLKECVSSMMHRLPLSPPLRTEPVFEFFEKYLTKFFSNPVINNFQRRQFNPVKDHELPILISNYNQVASWLITKVTDVSDLGSISWPPSELCFTDKELPPPLWNSKERLQALQTYLEDVILLPEFPVTNDISFVEACHTLNKYVKAVGENSPSTWKLASNINNILEKARPQPKSRKRARFAKISPQLSSSIIPRTSIVLALVEFQLSNLYGLKDLNFQRLLTVSYFEDLITDSPALIFPPTLILEESLDSNCSCLNHKALIIAKDDFDTLVDEISDEREANESLLNYLQEAINDTNDLEPRSKKTRFH